jgi:exonuclease III
MNKKALHIIFWIANGLTSREKKLELENYLNEKKIDIALISETHMKPSNQLKICNYDTHRKERKIKNGGGVAILTPELLDIAVTKNITTQMDCYNENELTSDLHLIRNAKITERQKTTKKVPKLSRRH